MKQINLSDVFKPERAKLDAASSAWIDLAGVFVSSCIEHENRKPAPSLEGLRTLVECEGLDTLRSVLVELPPTTLLSVGNERLFCRVRAVATAVLEATLAGEPVKPDPEVKLVQWFGSIGIAAVGLWLLFPALTVLGLAPRDSAYESLQLAQLVVLGILGICLLVVGPRILWKPALLKSFRP